MDTFSVDKNDTDAVDFILRTIGFALDLHCRMLPEGKYTVAFEPDDSTRVVLDIVKRALKKKSQGKAGGGDNNKLQ